MQIKVHVETDYYDLLAYLKEKYMVYYDADCDKDHCCGNCDLCDDEEEFLVIRPKVGMDYIEETDNLPF